MRTFPLLLNINIVLVSLIWLLPSVMPFTRGLLSKHTRYQQVITRMSDSSPSPELPLPNVIHDYYESTTTSNIPQNDASPIIYKNKERIKSKLVASVAACDRGFGASSLDRKIVDKIMKELIDHSTSLNPDQNFTRNLFPFNHSDHHTTGSPKADIEGVWRMVYTDAFDVLNLAASPFTLVQGIYQVIKGNGDSVNVIDLTSRASVLLPVQLATAIESVLRLKVFTQLRARTSARVGLTFDKIQIQPLKFLGMNPSIGSLSYQLPKPFISDAIAAFTPAQADADGKDKDKGVHREAGFGYFDVLYLDEDMLIIRQNQPGGIFINMRADVELGDINEFL